MTGFEQLLVFKVAGPNVTILGPVIIYDQGEGSQMTFYGKYFRGPLGAQRKIFAAFSTLRHKILIPTFIGRNKHVL